jgi:FlaG/FlaF family flagellin (archaellin)
MTAGKRDFVIEQGATFEEPIVWMQAGVPVNLTGMSARMLIKPKRGSTTVLRDMTSTNGEIVLGTTDGTITPTITDEETTLITWKKGEYVLEITETDGTVRRLLQGKIKMDPR